MAPAGEADSLWVKIPDDKDVDLSIGELAKMVVTSSNTYSDAARFNGMIKAELSKAEGRYKAKYKEAAGEPAKNEAGREANATKATKDELDSLQLVLYLSKLAQAAEDAARIASESSRKLLDKAANVHIGETRAEHGAKYEQTPIDTGF